MDFDGPVPGIPGATIRRADALPERLANGQPAGPHMSAEQNRMLMTPPGIGRFLAQDGNAIAFAPDPEADPGMVKLLLNGSARGALIHQRGELPLHAATLVHPRADGALAICGPSGAGKSTLAAELSRRGWILVADDTTRVTWNDTHPLAWPSRDSIKLWRDACEAAGIEIAGLEQVAASLEKYYVRVPARDEPVKLAAIVELVLDETPVEAAMTPGEKMALITRNTYRPAYIVPLGRQLDHVRIAGRIASTCSITRLRGGRERPLAMLADAVEKMRP